MIIAGKKKSKKTEPITEEAEYAEWEEQKREAAAGLEKTPPVALTASNLPKPKSKSGIRCPHCGAYGLQAICTLPVVVPLAKGGGLKMAGTTITHEVVKAAWETQIKQIVCYDCGQSLRYVEGRGLSKH